MTSYQRRKLVNQGVILPRPRGRPKKTADGAGVSQQGVQPKSPCPLCENPMLTGAETCKACFLAVGRLKKSKRELARDLLKSNIGQRVVDDIRKLLGFEDEKMPEWHRQQIRPVCVGVRAVLTGAN